MTTPKMNNTTHRARSPNPFQITMNRPSAMSMSIDIPILERFDIGDLEPKSKSIPIQKYLRRTPSELQLCQDEAVADYRDYCMYSRILGGITRQQMKQHDLRQRYQNDITIENIMRTRHDPGPFEPFRANENMVGFQYPASARSDDWAPDLDEADSSNETDSEQSDTLFELDL